MKTCQNRFDHHKRTDRRWLEDLRGHHGIALQTEALSDLSRYLLVVAYNAVKKRHDSLLSLQVLSDESLELLAEDFSQDLLLKISKNNFALLDKYEARGKFTSWLAQIANNEIAVEFRKAHWNRQLLLSDAAEHQLLDQKSLSPETQVLNSYVNEVLGEKIAALPENMRVALVRCLLLEERATNVALDMGVSANTVYLLIHRAKKILRKKLDYAQVGGNYM